MQLPIGYSTHVLSPTHIMHSYIQDVVRGADKNYFFQVEKIISARVHVLMREERKCMTFYRSLKVSEEES